MNALIVFFVIFTGMAGTPFPAFAANHPAADTIENLQASIVAIMKEGDKIGFEGRYKRFTPVITGSFDLPFIARTTVGRYWDSFDASQKSRFVEAFSRLSISTYAFNFDTYSGERFVVASQKDLTGGQYEVKTYLVKADGGKVSLDYVLRLTANEWRIINVIANGVSDLALKRADYTNYLKGKGFDALLSKLNEKISHYSP
jgi:phospholipid transport system substrate-binding protein